MACGDGGDANFVESVGGLPPIHFLNLRILRDAFDGEARADAEWDGEGGIPLGGDTAQSGDVEMIVVVVALQDQIDCGELIEVNAGGAVSRRSDPGKRTGAMRPDGIAENVQAFELDQERGMSDESGADFSIVDAFWGSRARRRVNPFTPGRAAASEQPFEHASRAVHTALRRGVARIVKVLAVEMVGGRTAVEWHSRFELRYFSLAALAFGFAGGTAGPPLTAADSQPLTDVPPLIME